MLVSDFRKTHNLSDTSFRRLVQKTVDNLGISRDELIVREGNSWSIKSPESLVQFLSPGTKNQSEQEQNSPETIEAELVENLPEAPITLRGIDLPDLGGLTGGLVLKTQQIASQSLMVSEQLSRYNAQIDLAVEQIREQAERTIESAKHTLALTAETKRKQEEIRAATRDLEMTTKLTEIMTNQAISSLNNAGK